MDIIKNKNFRAGRNCGQRTEKVQYIVIHYTGSEGTAANNISYFNSGDRGASAHYFVDRSGAVCEYCDPAKWYAWHCGGSLESSHHPYHGKCTNRNSIGIEICTHYNGKNWEFTDKAVAAAVELTKYLMQQFGVPAANVIRHYDVTGKACPRVPGWGAVGGSAEWDKFKKLIGGVSGLSKGSKGDAVKEMQNMLIACGYSCGECGADGSFGNDTLAALKKFEKAAGLAVDGIYSDKDKAALTKQYAAKKPQSAQDQFIAMVGAMAKADMAKSGICAAITVAQAILESGWGKSELAKNANNLFGMKKNLSGNTWKGSAWDGKSVYSKDTKEVYASGPATIRADFRAYKDWQSSVNDHSAYLAGAKNGSALRYKGLVGCTDYKKAAQIIKDGGYATAPDYVQKLCKLVEQYGLTKYNTTVKTAAATKTTATAKTKEIKIWYPGYTRKSSPYDSNGSGSIWHDQNKNTLVIDCYLKNSPAANRMIKYLVNHKLTKVDFVGTHAHGDHLGGGFQLLEDDRITVENIYVYDPDSLKLAGDGTRNGRSVQDDKNYLKKFIAKAKEKGAKVHYVKTGDVIRCGEIELDVYREQPKHWTEYDTGEGWAYVNDGSICLYSKQSYYVTAGDASAAEFIEAYNLFVRGGEVGHHGNNGTRTKAVIFDKHGCIFAIQCNNEAGKPGSCEFTRYGSGRMREQGVEVWQLDADIMITIRGGTATAIQGTKTISWAVPFGKGDPVTGPFLVKVTDTIPILKAPAGAKVKDCPEGIYTIVEEKSGYGKLKSGAGWIQLSKAKKV